MRRLAAAGAFFVAYCAVVVASLLPTERLPEVKLSDKIEHLIAYAALAVLGGAAFPGRLRALAVFLVASGVAVEVLQHAMGLGRQGDVVDAVANTLGVALGAGLIVLLRRRRS